MKLLLLTVGKLRDPWVQSGCAEYEKRLRARFPLEIVEAKDHAALQRKLPPRFALWVLDERGQQFSSLELAQKLDLAKQSAMPGLALCIGGADGTPPSFRDQAHCLWSLSKLTFPHRLARLLVLEQLYRAQSILENSPYHRS